MRWTALFSLLVFVGAASAATSDPPCAQVSALQASGKQFVPGKLAYDCLTSVPFDSARAVKFITQFANTFAFQSDLAWLKNPPQQPNSIPAIDVMASLDAIRDKARANKYPNNYEFEADVRRLLNKLHDGHVFWTSKCLEGAFHWGHSVSLASVSSSPDELPKVYLASDVYPKPKQQLKAISTINGVPADKYLMDLSEANSEGLQDPDSMWNMLFLNRQLGNMNYGYFGSSGLYPGRENITFTLENSNQLYSSTWSAYIAGSFSGIKNGKDWLDRCTSTSPSKHRREALDQSDDNESQDDAAAAPATSSSSTTIVNSYPPPSTTLGKTYSTYLLNDAPGGKTGVLAIHNFQLTPSGKAALDATRDFLKKTITDWKNQGVKNIMFDMSGNPGGSVDMGYEVLNAFFPGWDPENNTNMRASPASKVFIEYTAKMLQDPKVNANAAMKNTLQSDFFNYVSLIDAKDGKPFTSWQDLYGTTNLNGDTFTNWGLARPVVEPLGIPQAWNPENAVVISNGICSSTCTIVTEAMHMGGVRTFTYGGRPQKGPMQATGGVEGSQVLSFAFLGSLGQTFMQANPEDAKKNNWADFMPSLITDFAYPPQNPDGPTLNFKNAFRNGTDIPLQFLYTPSDCRMFQTIEMLNDVTKLWKEVANRLWGSNKNSPSCKKQ